MSIPIKEGKGGVVGVMSVLQCFVLGTSCVFNFSLLALCNESFSETIPKLFWSIPHAS